MVNAAWRFEEHVDGVRALHELGIPEVAERLVRWCTPNRRAIVLGSAQPDHDVKRDVAERLGIDVVRRRSGGGAVLVEPNGIVWVDIVIPKGDVLWHDDVGKAFHWLGHVWVAALHQMGIAGLHVHEGALVSNEWSRKVCFAGLGPGEVTREGRKVVGISQKRTRAGALFQCALLLHSRHDVIASLITAPSGALGAAHDVLRGSTFAVGDIDTTVFRYIFAATLRETS